MLFGEVEGLVRVVMVVVVGIGIGEEVKGTQPTQTTQL